MSPLRSPQRFVKRRKSGWPQAMHVVDLGGGETLVHSPTWIDDATLAEVRALGAPKYLFAPNHYHWLSLPRYREAFPGAVAVASRTARKRLAAKGNEGLRSVDEAELPSGMRWLVPEGTKSGEAWLSIDGEGGPTWLVCDGFFHETAKVRGVEGMVLRWAKITPGLCLGDTFKRVCLADRAKYMAWVLDALDRERPRRVLFSHGDPFPPPGIAKHVEGDVVTSLGDVLRARLG